MAQDMWSIVNRELAKIEKEKGGRSATPTFDVLSETMKYAKEDRAWRERKNLQRQSIMSELAKDTNRLYNNDDAQFQKGRFKKYFDRNKGNMDENTLEMGQMMLENYDRQISKNDDFSKYKDGMDSQMQKIDDFLKKPEFEIGKEYTDKEVEEFREVYQGYVDFTEKFTTNHADRLQLAGNSHVLQDIQQGAYANKFMLDSFFGDKKIDETEHGAYSQALASNSLEPITKYKEYEKKLITHSNDSLIKSMDDNAALLKNYKLVAEGADMSIALGKDYAGQRVDPDSEEAGIIDDMIESLTDELGEDNKRHIDRHSISYLDQPHMKGLLDPATQPKKTKTKKIELKVDTTALSDSTEKKYQKALERKPDMTRDEFIKNRPDLKEKELEIPTLKAVKSNLQGLSDKFKDISKDKHVFGYNKITKGKDKKQLTEDGVNVQYKIKVKTGSKDDEGKDKYLSDVRESVSSLLDKPAKLSRKYIQDMDLENAKYVYEVYKQDPYTGKYKLVEERDDIDNLIKKLGY